MQTKKTIIEKLNARGIETAPDGGPLKKLTAKKLAALLLDTDPGGVIVDGQRADGRKLNANPNAEERSLLVTAGKMSPETAEHIEKIETAEPTPEPSKLDTLRARLAANETSIKNADRMLALATEAGLDTSRLVSDRAALIAERDAIGREIETVAARDRALAEIDAVLAGDETGAVIRGLEYGAIVVTLDGEKPRAAWAKRDRSARTTGQHGGETTRGAVPTWATHGAGDGIVAFHGGAPVCVRVAHADGSYTLHAVLSGVAERGTDANGAGTALVTEPLRLSRALRCNGDKSRDKLFTRGKLSAFNDSPVARCYGQRWHSTDQRVHSGIARAADLVVTDEPAPAPVRASKPPAGWPGLDAVNGS